jgi:hypothetical protein
MAVTKFPQSQFGYPFEQLAKLHSWGPESFLKFVLLIQSLEQARTWAECNFAQALKADLDMDDESIVKMLNLQVKDMVECGWEKAASSALYYAIQDYQPLQKALLQYHPEADKLSEQEAAFSVFENCRPR